MVLKREPEFQVGQAVWIEGRKQPNGKIVYIDRENEELIVKYYDTNEEEGFEFAALEGNWTDKFNGAWHLPTEYQ